MLSRLLEIRLEWLFVGLVGMGLALIMASWSIGVADVVFNPATVGSPSIPVRQVGYVPALNWGITYVMFFPVAGVMLVGVLQDIPRVTAELERLQVLRTEPGVPAADPIVTEWKTGTFMRNVFIAVLGIGFPVVYSIREWFFNNFLRLRGAGPRANYWDWDWGLKCAMPEYTNTCSVVERSANAIFDLACFLAQGVYLVLLLTFLIYVLDFRHALLRPRAGVSLMPALRLKDPRRGFGQFEPLLTKMLIVVLVSFLAAYSLRLENLYLRSQSTSLWSYVKADVIQASFAGLDGGFSSALKSLPENLFDIGGSAGSQTVLAAIGLMFLFAVVVSVVVGTVGGAARCARTNALAHYANPAAEPLFGFPLEEEQERAESMAIWPIGYLRVNRLLLWTLLAVASLVWFRIGLFVVGASIGFIVINGGKAIERLIQSKGE